MGNKNMNKAKAAGNDEFYTMLETIEQEVMHYRPHFKGKTVYLNCDDPRESNFFKYFSYNFERLGLKKLIASCYKSQDYNLFSLHDVNEKAVWLEYTGEKDGGRVPTAEAIGIHQFKGDGDFRSQESIELLKEADIVVTNPPFSLFREFIAQLVEYDKKFLVIGNFNAVAYKEVFPLLVENKLWAGVSPRSIDFIKQDRSISTVNASWWTNLTHRKRNEELILYKKYNTEDYKEYVNYNAIEVSKVSEIPMDYSGFIGVPITFIEKYNPEQFEIIGSSLELAESMDKYANDGEYTKGGKSFYIEEDNKGMKYKRLYHRIVIRNKRLQDSQDNKGDE